jgi:hypothetical protein
MDSEIRMDGKAIREVIGDLASLSKQVPYAAMIAINRTAEEATHALRPHVQQVFTVREPRLLDLVAPRTLPATQRASKERLSVTLRSKDYARVFEPFERGAAHVAGRSLDGREQPVIIPTSTLRPSKATRIARSWYPTNLGLEAKRTINPRREGPYYFALGRGSLGGKVKGKKAKKNPFHTTSGGRLQIKGRRGTFVLDKLTAPTLDPKKYGVYRREGGEVRKLWNFAARVERKPILQFEAIQSPIAKARLPINFLGAFELAKRTAR